MSKFAGIKVSARAAAALAHAKVSSVSDDLKVAKNQTAKEYEIKKILKTQEQRDQNVLKIQGQIDDVSDAIKALEVKRSELFQELTEAQALANDVQSLRAV